MDDVFTIFKKRNKNKKRASTGNGKENINDKKSLFNLDRKNPRRAHNAEDGLNYNGSDINNKQDKKGNNPNNNENYIVVDFPSLPYKNTEACISFYYIEYLRNQILYGNKNLRIDENTKIMAEELLDKIETTIYELENSSENLEDSYKIEIKTIIFKAIYDRYYKIYTTLIAFSDSAPQPNNLYEYILNNGVYIRSKRNNDFNCRENIHNVYSYLDNIEIGNNDLSYNLENIYIESIDISRPTIINKTLINTDIEVEYLPLKFNCSYCYKNLQYAKLFLNNAINMSLYEKALGELIVAKALVDIPSVPVEFVEGFDVKEMKAGERQWIPIYLGIALSAFTYVDVEFPFWFYIKNFVNIKEEEYKNPDELFELPSPYFFEICYMFVDQKVFSKSTPIETVGKKSYFRYMEKVAATIIYVLRSMLDLATLLLHPLGYVEDIKHCRREKIIRRLEEQNVHTNHIYIKNLQLSETYIINLSLYSFWKYDKNLNDNNNSIDFTSYLLEPFIKELKTEEDDDENILQDL